VVHLDFREALDEMVDQMKNCGPGQVQIDGFTAGRIAVTKQGPTEAAFPMGYHRLCPLWLF
jgi:hypothetical protein